MSVEAETPFDYFVTSNPSGTEAVRVDSWISPTNYSYSSGELPVIEADVRKGGAGVLNANVMAVIGTDRSTACNIPMLDDGNGKFVSCHIISYLHSFFRHERRNILLLI